MAVCKKRLDRHYFPLLVASIIVLSNCFSSATAQFEYFKLVLQWPFSVCSQPEAYCQRDPLPFRFTIHGLWPDNRSQPLSDCDTVPLNDIVNSRLLQRMKRSWPDLYQPRDMGPSYNFWSEQWKKHGTCSLPFYSQTSYLIKALDLTERFNLRKILREKRVTPGRSFKLSRVTGIIKAETQGSPILKCRNGYLTEVIICFDPSGNSVINCPLRFANPCREPIVDFPIHVHR